MEIFAWLILRVAYAWIFLSPLPNLLKNWPETKTLTQLLIPNIATNFLTIIMVCIMFFGALSILLGVFGQIAGFALLIYCLLGAVVHSRLAKKAQKIFLSPLSSTEDQQKLQEVIQLATVGNITSADKNIVLAAVGLFFTLMGTGPYSLVNQGVVDMIVKSLI